MWPLASKVQTLGGLFFVRCGGGEGVGAGCCEGKSLQETLFLLILCGFLLHSPGYIRLH